MAIFREELFLNFDDLPLMVDKGVRYGLICCTARVVFTARDSWEIDQILLGNGNYRGDANYKEIEAEGALFNHLLQRIYETQEEWIEEQIDQFYFVPLCEAM